MKPADLLFVFGTREDVGLRVDEALRLWREGFFRWSIVSGGMTPGSEISECAVIKNGMVAGGIPPERILEEHRAIPARTCSSHCPSSKQRLGLRIFAT